MYHGATVPGFPAHPHRGFETVTIVREGLIDHSDSLGRIGAFRRRRRAVADRRARHRALRDVSAAAARARQPARTVPDLAQPAGQPQDGRAAFHDVLVRAGAAPCASPTPSGARPRSTCIAGACAACTASAPPAPPPDSWASQPQSDVAIWTIAMAPGRTLDAARRGRAGTRRCLYFFEGSSLCDRWRATRSSTPAWNCAATATSNWSTAPQTAQMLVLQGRPIAEPVAQHGPFVMNTQAEIHQAFADYQRTRFGGWPWPDDAPVHGKEPRRFATHPDGSSERSAHSTHPPGVTPHDS